MISEEIVQITRIFHPFYVENYERALEDNIRFVPYTSASACPILQNWVGRSVYPDNRGGHRQLENLLENPGGHGLIDFLLGQ